MTPARSNKRYLDVSKFCDKKCDADERDKSNGNGENQVGITKERKWKP